MKNLKITDWDSRIGSLTIEQLLNLASYSEFRIYENDLVEGSILDVGSGIGHEALYYAHRGRRVYSIDKEDYFLSRIKEISKGEIITCKSTMPKGKLPEDRYALVILSNILHFLTLSEGRLLCKRISQFLPSNCFVLLRVHSNNHPYSKVNHSKHRNFKHFYSAKEIKNLFSQQQFNSIYFSNYRRRFSSFEINIFGLNSIVSKEKDSFTFILQKK